MLLSSIFTTLAGMAVFATVLAKPMTNAERFKRGLPPNAPRRRWSPSRTHWHHARASNSPATTAYIEAYDAGGTALGYLYKVDSNFYGITTAQSNPAALFTVPAGYTGPYNTIQDGTTYVAIDVQNLPGGSNTMASGNNYGVLGFTSTPDNGQADASTFVASNYYETSIVSVPDDLYGNLQISFTDTDGTVSVLNAYYHAASPDIYLAVNSDAMGSGWDETNDKITLKWVATAAPISTR